MVGYYDILLVITAIVSVPVLILLAGYCYGLLIRYGVVKRDEQPTSKNTEETES